VSMGLFAMIITKMQHIENVRSIWVEFAPTLKRVLTRSVQCLPCLYCKTRCSEKCNKRKKKRGEASVSVARTPAGEDVRSSGIINSGSASSGGSNRSGNSSSISGRSSGSTESTAFSVSDADAGR
jgi:hypothetical protein